MHPKRRSITVAGSRVFGSVNSPKKSTQCPRVGEIFFAALELATAIARIACSQFRPTSKGFVLIYEPQNVTPKISPIEHLEELPRTPNSMTIKRTCPAMGEQETTSGV